MAKVNLQDAYLLVPIHQHYRKYLRFRFANRFYEYNCLCFGINCAPRLFTKIIKPCLSTEERVLFRSLFRRIFVAG